MKWYIMSMNHETKHSVKYYGIKQSMIEEQTLTLCNYLKCCYCHSVCFITISYDISCKHINSITHILRETLNCLTSCIQQMFNCRPIFGMQWAIFNNKTLLKVTTIFRQPRDFKTAFQWYYFKFLRFSWNTYIFKVLMRNIKT